MSLSLEEIKSAACGLAADERADLAEYLLDSLDEKAKEEALRQRQIQEITREVLEQRRDAYQRLA